MPILDANVRKIRAQSLVSPYFFIKTLLKNPDMCEKIHGVELEKTVRAMAAGKRYRWIEWPRGFLKCLPGDQEVVTASGRYVRMDELVVGAKVLSMTDDYRVEWRRVTAKQKQGIQPCLKVRFQSGREVVASTNHPFRLIDKWVNAEHLNVGDRVPVTGLVKPPDATKSLPYAEILGWFLGDGSMPRQMVSNIDPELQRQIAAAAERAGGSASIRGRYVNVRGLRPLFRRLGLLGCRSADKFIPREVFESSDQSVREVLYGLYMSDGTSHKKLVSLTTKSERMAREVQRLLLRFDIFSQVSRVGVSYKGSKRPFYYVTVSSEKLVERFRSEIGWGKNWRFEPCGQSSGATYSAVPAEWRSLLPESAHSRAYRRPGMPRIDNSYATGKDKIAYWAEAVDDDRLRGLASDDLYWDKVVAISNAGTRETWDIEVEGGNFAVNDIVTHNSTTFTLGLSVWLTLPEDEHDKECAINELEVDPKVWDERSKLRNQNISQLLAYETLDMAKAKLAMIRKYYEEYDLFRLCFPEIAHNGTESPWNTEKLCIRRDKNKPQQPDSTFEAIGVGAAGQSRHFDVIWCDDVVGKDAIKSEQIMADTIQWFGQLNGMEQLGGRTWRFGVSNRWGFNDLNSHLRLNEPHWEFSCLKAYNTNEKGERVPTWPEVYTLEVLDQKLASMHEDEFYAQYQNEPRPPGGADMDSDKFHVYTIRSANEIWCKTCQKSYYIEGMNRYIHYDPYNAKKKLSRSLPAIAVVGTTVDKHVFLLDSYIKKDAYEKIFAKLFELNTVWDPVMLTYEDVGAQNMTEFYIKQFQKSKDFKSMKARPFRRIEPVSTAGKPMEIRVRDYLVPVIEKGKFGIHENQNQILEMAATFPHTVPGHDYDLLDALAQGPRVWRYPMDSEEESRYDKLEQERLRDMASPYSEMLMR